MSSGDTGDKTELPSDRRRQQAREQGNIARSQDLITATVSLAAASAMLMFGTGFVESQANVLRLSLSQPAWVRFDPQEITQQTFSLAQLTATAVVPMLLVLMVGSLAINLAQVGFLWSPDVLQFKFERVNPLSGFQRLFSLQSVVRLIGGVLKIIVLGFIAYLFISGRLPQLLRLGHGELSQGMAIAGGAVVDLAFWLSGSLFTLAVLDYGYQWWNHEQELMMSKQEVREEMKEMDGDPQTRARRREAHRKLTAARELSGVKTADVVVTNPTHIAVALKYDPATMPAPTVVAKGMGEIAAQIRRIAAENGVPILERKPLARALYKSVKVGQTIPAEMYDAFVEILAYVYRITGRTPPNMSA